MNIRKIFFLFREGAIHFVVGLMKDGSQPASHLDLANAFSSQLEPNEELNVAVLNDDGSSGTLTWVTPQEAISAGLTSDDFHTVLAASLSAAYPLTDDFTFDTFEWSEGSASLVTSTTTTTTTTTTSTTTTSTTTSTTTT